MFARVALLAFTAAVSVKALTISTPQVFQCQDVTFDIGGATDKVWFTVLPAQNSCESDAIYEGEATVVDGKYTWRPEIPAGTEIVILIDNNGAEEAWSAPITVGGSADACNPSSSSTTSTSTTDNSPAGTFRPSSNGGGSGSGSNVDTPENAADAPEDTPGAAMTVKAQLSMTVLAAFAGVIAIFA